MPALNIFETSYRRGKFDASRKLSDGSMMEFKHIYPMDAVFDTQADVPEEVRARNSSSLRASGGAHALPAQLLQSPSTPVIWASTAPQPCLMSMTSQQADTQ